MLTRPWQSITPLPDDCDFDFAEINSLQRQWLNVKQAREESDPTAYHAFMERLTRSWAIETGIIEGLYTLDRGMTETLVMHGISADLIEHSSTDKDPHELNRILTDHQNAVRGVYLEIQAGKPINLSAIRQLHSTLTHSQPTFQAIDQFGRWFDTELQHGGFKTLPNKPTPTDGTVHEYCPPEHVHSELDELLAWYELYIEDTDRYHPLLTGAWLHHRFTRIHPFQDGNGRVVRALLTWHLARENYLPVVIKRDDRDDYIDALEKADDGNLKPFVDLLVRLQRQTIFEALDVGETVSRERPAAVDQVLDHIVAQISRQNADSDAKMRSVNTVAQALRNDAGESLKERFDQIVLRLEQAGDGARRFYEEGGPGDKEHWYHSEIVETSRNAGHWMNHNEARFFVKLTLAPTGRPRLVFVVSLHHTGRQLTGVMAATAFARIGRYSNSLDDTPDAEATHAFADCTPLAPFTFTCDDDANALLPRFREWTEQSLAIALRQWSQHLT